MQLTVVTSSFLRKTNLSRRTTFPSVSRLLLIWLPSFSLIPAEAVCDARSLPARSTKFCPQEEYKAQNFPHERIINVGLYFHTTQATRVLEFPLPKNFLAELSIV
jgi:hypothetical protein